MSTYNGSRYLREQVESILLQLGPMDELVVVAQAAIGDVDPRVVQRDAGNRDA